jgi:serine/threonine protein phosphatase PrpC
VSGPFAFTSAGASHVGRVRTINEDAWAALPERGIWAVADGMGGHSRGDVAARMVVDALTALPPAEDARTLRRSVEEAIHAVNAQLRRHNAAGEISGATVVVLLAHGRHFAILWAGDSRAYRNGGAGLTCLTRDHSLVQELIDRGELSAQEARHHPLGNRITRAVGAAADLVLDAVQGELVPGDVFVLCSDGLTKHLDDVEIAAAIDGAPPARGASTLIERTLERGASDNVTAVVVAIGVADAVERTGVARASGPGG